ncbi:type II toxin-antitoxin system VapC family toxin [Tolypothrix sp. VBCCA 56010]|uniref:type II toxin-antitoxin system VapC family toxin n=1 Tax=Tolypothrix sp. VBCCA 56010 TaxID=3137731 RepID=UPI003D7DE906
MYLLDTNHCSYIINNTPSVITALRSRSANEIGIQYLGADGTEVICTTSLKASLAQKQGSV